MVLALIFGVTGLYFVAEKVPRQEIKYMAVVQTVGKHLQERVL